MLQKSLKHEKRFYCEFSRKTLVSQRRTSFFHKNEAFKQFFHHIKARFLLFSRFSNKIVMQTTKISIQMFIAKNYYVVSLYSYEWRQNDFLKRHVVFSSNYRTSWKIIDTSSEKSSATCIKQRFICACFMKFQRKIKRFVQQKQEENWFSINSNNFSSFSFKTSSLKFKDFHCLL